MPVEMLKAFADPGSRSLMVETASDDAVTAIRIGNAGIARVLPTLAASCAAGSAADPQLGPQRHAPGRLAPDAHFEDEEKPPGSGGF